MNDHDKLAERIGKLLSLADDQAGTPEGDTFQQRAFDLLAKHGIAESEARGTTREGKNVVECLTFQISGPYLHQQIRLLCAIAHALHCENIYWIRSGIVKIYGVKLHTDRVRLLFAIVNPQMAAGAARARPPAWSSVNARAYRIDWMAGYYTRIRDRLRAAENNAAAQHDSEKNTKSQELVWVSDKDRAKAALRSAHPKVKASKYQRDYNGHAVRSGYAAAESARLDHTEIGRPRRAIDRQR